MLIGKYNLCKNINKQDKVFEAPTVDEEYYIFNYQPFIIRD